MKIQRLPAEARSKLQSGILVTDAVQCVLELVHNALDAEATGVAVRIDLKNFKIKVIDNGNGIAKDDLEFVGERFMTSKYQPVTGLNTSFQTYGYKGQAISSLLDVCKTLIIETIPENDGPAFKKVFQNNNALPITEVHNERRGTGTTVTVEDFMCTMPVRRRRINEVFDIEEIKTQLQYLAIIHYNVCFTLRNENKGLILLQTCQASSVSEAVSNVYGSSTAKSLKHITYRENNYDITGHISLKPQNQNLQLVYINKRIITKGVIHKFINNVMKEYGEKKNLFNYSPGEEGPLLKKLKNFSNNLFVLQINCPLSFYELFTNMRKTTVEFRNWKDVLKYLHKALKRAFKLGDKSLDSSVNAGHSTDKNDGRDGVKKKFGTSLLVNAVRGAPVKRRMSRKKDGNKKKKKRLKDDVTLLESTVQNCKSLEVHLESCSVGSSESPIPRNRFKPPISQTTIKKISSEGPEQSYIQFYEWVKTKFKTDLNAFNLYNDFLQSKRENFEEASRFTSPVLIRKEKKSQNLKKLENKKPRISPERKIDEEIASVAEKHLNILPHNDSGGERARQFITENSIQLSRGLRTSKLRFDGINFESSDYGQIFKKPSALPPPNAFRRASLPSPASSEVQFRNIIKFRNSSESFVEKCSNIRKEMHLENEISATITSTWTSHYQDRVLEAHRNGGHFGRKDFADDYRPIRNLEYEFEKPCHPVRHVNQSMTEFVRMQDAGIQVNMCNTNCTGKADAAVQTSDDHIICVTPFEDCFVPESPSFENGMELMVTGNYRNGSGSFHKGEENTQAEAFEEVPAPDFWNTSTPRDYLKTTATDSTRKNSVANERKSSSGELVCRGQKTNSGAQSQNERSTSKETQTHAALWPESLTDMENLNSRSFIASSLHNTRGENMQLPKTIPLEELECNFTAPIDTAFALTERHDFVPKGLSPKFFNVEPSSLPTLSPREKGRIKLTIDNTENELLADVKWQDEATGSSTKPTIPDGILCEMREKAEKSLINHQNQILSASLSYCAIKVHNLLHSFAFTKELLAEVEILGQLDKKFIATKMQISTPKKMELISLFDQHAVDERIKLEQLMNDHISPVGKFRSSSLNPPAECSVSESDMNIISNLEEKMRQFGLGFTVTSENTISVHAVPTFILNKHEKDVKNGKDASLAEILHALVLNIAEEIAETRGAASKIPKIIHNAFCLEACHRAIKFNRMLTKEAMTEMINKLKSCKLPFQCAHGRPSVIPIIDLEDFKQRFQSEDIDRQKLKLFLNKRNADSASGNI